MNLERKSTAWLKNKLLDLELTPYFGNKIGHELDKREAHDRY